MSIQEIRMYKNQYFYIINVGKLACLLKWNTCEQQFTTINNWNDT